MASAVVFSCQWEDVTATPGRNGIISPVLAAKKGLRGYALIGPLATAPSRKVLIRCSGDTFAWSGPVGRGPSQWSYIDRGARCDAQGTSRTAADPEPSSGPVAVATETVNLLAASRAGDLKVAARGQGQERVDLSIRNRSTRRLNEIVPPGMVAASMAGQGGRGGGAGGGGLQSMGLGSAANRDGAFGEFRGAGGLAGSQSVAAIEEARSREIAVPVGETIELSIPAVCLNHGKATPTPRDRFKLVDVEEYSQNPQFAKRYAAARPPTAPARGSPRPSCGGFAMTCRSRP